MLKTLDKNSSFCKMFSPLFCFVQGKIIEELDRKTGEETYVTWAVSNRRLVVSCSEMALDGSITVEICYFNFGACFSLRLLSYGDGDPSKPHLNLQGKHFLLLFCAICPCFEKIASQKLTLPEPY